MSTNHCSGCDGSDVSADGASEEPDDIHVPARLWSAFFGFFIGAQVGFIAESLFGAVDPGWRRAVAMMLIPAFGLLFWLQDPLQLAYDEKTT